MRVAIIPARGGSKRIPRKNIRSFAGKPMIAHSIEVAQRSQLFDRIIVSTDDDEISRVARAFDAEVPFVRPQGISDDKSGTGAVIAHAVQFLQQQGASLSGVCCIYATAPFIRAADLQQALAMFESGGHDYVFCGTSFAYPIFRAFSESARGGLEMFFPDKYHIRSQDLPEALHDAGQFYWGSPQAWVEQRQVFGPNSAIVRIPRWRVQDIDTVEDWMRAEAMASYLNARGGEPEPSDS